MPSIYRKYRPQTFADMVGQNQVKLTLQNELETNTQAQAYLFCGPRGLGKTTAARLMAKVLNCEKRKAGQSEPCNQCSSCLDIIAGKSLDVIEIDAASHTGVDNVRENIIENTRFSPAKSKYKIYIIDEVHMLSISAFNALLKTLEEPPTHTVFILCTTELHKVPETIISRCQRFDFKKVVSTELIKRLKRLAGAEGVKIDDEVFELIASKSEGCMRDAETLLGQVLSLGGKHITKEQAGLVLPATEAGLMLELINLLIQNNIGQALDFVNNLVEEGVDLQIFTQELVELLRKFLLAKVGANKAVGFGLGGGLDQEANKILGLINEKKIIEMMELLLKAGQELKSTIIPSLPLELAVLKIGRYESAEPLGFKLDPAKFRNPVIHPAAAPLAAKPNQPQTKTEPSGKISLTDIKAKWRQIIQAGHKRSRDLTFVNSNLVWPLKVNRDGLEIGFKYELHQSRFEANHNQALFSEALAEIFGEKITVKSKVLKPSELAELDISQAKESEGNEPPSGVKVTEDNILDKVMESFGGEVVE